jgi:quercetin dioxygenase-like cupin family protein
LKTSPASVIDVVRWNKSKRPSLEELQEALGNEGLECELYSDRPGTKYGRHKHDFDDFIVIVSGKFRISVEGNTWIMKPGDRLDLPASTVHWAEVVGKEEVRYLSAAE